MSLTAKITKTILSESINWSSVLKMPFVDTLKKAGGQVYVVGGSVRDHYLGKNSKDIDLLVRRLDFEEIQSLLAKYGKIVFVGESYGVLKFYPNDIELDEPIDIAIPRTERKMTSDEKEEYKNKNGKYPTAYQDFVMTSDKELTIKDDLTRRDFTINAITKDEQGKIYDPFNGMHDLKKKVIRMVSPKAFNEDPLRMLRAVQFASRFGFTIEPNTYKAIQQNCADIKKITGERILIELEKIISKGNAYLGFKILQDTGLYKQIFGFDFKGDSRMVDKAKRLSEFLYAITQRDSYESTDTLHSLLIKKLKLENKDSSEIMALELAWHIPSMRNKLESRMLGARMYKIAPSMLNMTMFPDDILKVIKDFKRGLPKNAKDLAIDGNELMQLGFKGQEIGIKKNLILQKIYLDRLKNDKKAIIQYLK